MQADDLAKSSPGLGKSGRMVASSKAYRDEGNRWYAFGVGLWKTYFLPLLRAPAEFFFSDGDKRTQEVMGDLFQMFIDHFVHCFGHFETICAQFFESLGYLGEFRYAAKPANCQGVDAGE